MGITVQISPETYNLLQKRATESRSTPDQLAETAIRLQLGNSLHIEQRPTPFGPQAYLRGTRVAVRHIAAFLKTHHTVEEIIHTDLPHLPPSAIYEAVAYYYDHQQEIETELSANDSEAVVSQLQTLLPPTQLSRLTGKSV